MEQLETLQKLYRNDVDKTHKDFFTFLQFKSISSEKAYSDEMTKCIDWLSSYIEELGFTVTKWPTSGYPVLFAQNCEAGPEKPTLLIYNHYDVQPVDPLELWNRPPFEPAIIDGQIYARGAQDNKGQCFYVLQALKLLLARDGKLPINVKLCIEGEEECGSAGLAGILEKYKKELRADVLAVVDVGLREKSSPAVTLGLRGIVTMDVIVKGTISDLHSGSHGGLAYNPLKALVEMLSKMYHTDGSIAIAGIYDDLQPLAQKDKGLLNLNFDAEEYHKTYGALPSGGENKLTPLERNWLRPSLEINGISGGYSGDGFKTVIPSKAAAKVSCRTVPGQDPKKIGELIANFLKDQCPPGISLQIDIHQGCGAAIRTNASSKAVTAFAKAYTEVFGKPCEYILEGASIPIATELAKASGATVVLIGLGLGTDNIHAPNEHFGVDRLEKGALIISKAIEFLATEFLQQPTR